MIVGQHTTSSDTSERTTVATATETGVNMEPTTTHTVNKEVLQTFADKARNYIATKTAFSWIKRFDTWRKARDIQQSLENIPADKLDELLQFFFADIRKNDGGEHEPNPIFSW